jgi:uncharacterized protein
MEKKFLTAEWRKLIMANYIVPPQLLEKYLPYKTELDLWNGNCYVSMVGFMFLNTRLKGIPIPFHTNFEEVNLRFYVKQRDKEGFVKRGAVFIKEIVPKSAITFLANLLYKEHYTTMKMNHVWEDNRDSLLVEYFWKGERWNSIKVNALKEAENIQSESEEEFITEHYWGYTRRNENETWEYRVDHPVWQIYKVNSFESQIDFGELYGNEFEFLKTTKPSSVFLAEGSEISIGSEVVVLKG